MADKTKIEWTEATWNAVTGCTEVSPGCDHCYAATIANRFAGQPSFPNGFGVTLRPERLAQPLSWKKPRRIFVNSMSDLFHQDIPDEYIARVFGTMALTPRHTYQVLTKRHARMRSLLNSDAFHLMVLAETARQQDEKHPMPSWNPGARRLNAWPLPNVWLGVSTENQKWADIRIPALLETPAAVRFISAEPLLGPIRLSAAWIDMPADARPVTPWDLLGIGLPNRLDWVIVGGESGHGARPVHPDWVRSLRDQSVAANVPFFHKQWGEWGPAPFIVRICDPKVGWTGTEGEHGTRVSEDGAKTGDLVLYGPFPHHHVEVVDNPKLKTTVGHGSPPIDQGVFDLFGDGNYEIRRYI